MKRKFKLSLFVATSILLVCSLLSCSDKNDPSWNDFYSSLVTVYTDAEGEVKSFTLDNKQTMFVSATSTTYIPRNERAIISYTILGEQYEGYDYNIKLNGYFEDVLTKPIIYVAANDKVVQDEIGYNSIKVLSVWAKGGYVNIRFAFKMAQEHQHELNLVAENESKIQQGDTPIKLQFRHNSNGDPENYYSPNMYVCFKLDEYIEANEENEKLEFEVSWMDYDGVEKSEILKYAMPN